MAKYKFEKYSLKWDESKWTGSSLNPSSFPFYKIEFDGSVTTVNNATGFEVGDILLVNAYMKGQYESGSATTTQYVVGFSGNGLSTIQSRVSYSKIQILTFRQKGDLIETIVDENEAYPSDGILGNYWYINIGKAFPSLKFKTTTGQLLSIGSAKYKDGNGRLREIANVYYKDSTGTVRNLK